MGHRVDAETDARVEKILASKLYNDRQEFCASLMATQISSDEEHGEHVRKVRYALDRMVREGSLQKRLVNYKARYRPRPRSLLSTSFRNDNDVYELSDQLNRGW